MNEELLPIDLCNLDEAIQVFPFAVIALAKLISPIHDCYTIYNVEH
jgi:hypothetical protein